MKKLLTFPMWVVLAVFVFVSCDKDCLDDGYADRIYAKEQWASDLQAIIPFGRIRLNNFTPQGGQFCGYQYNPGDPCDGRQPENSDFCPGAEFQFKHPCDCEINFLIGRKGFDLVVPRVGPDLMYKVYINDVNSRQIRVDALSHLTFGIDFESEGTEIKLNCYNNFFCFTGTPAFELDNMHVDIQLRLTAENGNITYDDVIVAVTADFQNSGMCKDNLFAFLCGNQREAIFSNLREQIRANLLKPDIRAFISESLTSHIRNKLSLGNKKIRRASLLGGSLILNLECI